MSVNEKLEEIEEEKGGMVSVTGEDNEKVYLYSIMPKDFINEHGLFDQAVVGKFADNQMDTDDKLIVDSFQPNQEFIYLLHEFLGSFGRHSTTLLSQLPHQEEGSWIYIIDRRVEDVNAAISPKDIIGGFLVEEGQLGEYAGNPSHELLTDEGIFQIGVKLKNGLINYIISKNKKPN